MHGQARDLASACMTDFMTQQFLIDFNKLPHLIGLDKNTKKKKTVFNDYSWTRFRTIK